MCICRLPALVVLNMCNNRLTSLPNQLGLLKKLQTLNLSLNQLKTLPASIRELRELRRISLSDNCFTHVPDCLSKLKKLERVNLDRNPISEPPRKDVVIAESFYVVKESDLCEDCLSKCHIERKKMDDVENVYERILLTNSS